MLKRIAAGLLAFPIAILMVTLAVTNRQSVRLALDPFNADPLISLELPLYVFLLMATLIGVLLGGAAVWLSQGRYRKSARAGSAEARRWRSEADRLTRERDSTVGSRSTAVVPAGRNRSAA